MGKIFAKQDDMWFAHHIVRHGQVSHMDNTQQLSLGIPDFLGDALMTSTKFEAHIPWLEGRPTSQWGDNVPVDDEDEEKQE